ncbi:DnaJ domain-containing protein [bacterium]|nr:DnaJ domain-containing protein [candidate division CSSED10-310 bacterium]
MNMQIEKGNLTGRTFPYLLRDIALKELTGLLSIRNDTQRKFLFFNNGDITFIQSSQPEEQLGLLMLRGGILDDEQYGVVRDYVRKGGWKHQNIYEIVSADTIEWWLRTLIREITQGIFLWEEGEYRFYYGRKPPKTCPTVSVDTMKLIFSSIRRVIDPYILIDWLESLDIVPKFNMEKFSARSADLNLTPQEAFFVSRIDGSMSFRQLLSISSGKQRLEMLQFFVAAKVTDLISAGILREIIQEPLQPVVESSETSTDETETHDEEEEFTDDIDLTDEELRDLERFKGDFEKLTPESFIVANQSNDKSQIDVDAKLSYLREGEFVEVDEESLDISSLKKRTLTAKEKGEDGAMRVFIDGVAIDAESDFMDNLTVKDILNSENPDEMWNRWMTISAEDTSADYLDDWETSWRTWEEQQNEIDELRKRREKISGEMFACSSIEKLEQLQRQYDEAAQHIERIIAHKKKEILTAYRRSQVQNYYEMLRLSEEASLDEVKSAYFKWLNEYQPEKKYLKNFEMMAEYLVKLVDQLHKAYEVLSNETSRNIYDKELEKQRKSAEVIAAKKKVLAKDHLISCREALKRGDVMLAMRFLRGSISLDPRNPVYYEEMAKILVDNPKWQNEALRLYHKAFHLNPENTDLLVEVAKLAIRLENPKFAQKALQQSLKINPENMKAKKLLAEVEKLS